MTSCRVDIREALIGLACGHTAVVRHVVDVTHIDLEVHRSDAVPHCVENRHILQLIALATCISVVVEKLKGHAELGVAGLIVDDCEGREMLCRCL